MLKPLRPGCRHSGPAHGAGFSLIELCVALAVVVIGATWALTTLSDVLSNNRLRSAGQQMYDALQLARSEAVKRNASVAVSVSGVSVSINYTPGVACGRNGASCQTLTFGAGTGLQVQLDNAASAALQFDSRGEMADLSGHTVDIVNNRCAAEQSCVRLLVRGGGTVRVCNPAQADTNASNYCA